VGGVQLQPAAKPQATCIDRWCVNWRFRMSFSSDTRDEEKHLDRLVVLRNAESTQTAGLCVDRLLVRLRVIGNGGNIG